MKISNQLIRDHRHLGVEIMYESEEFFSNCCTAPVYYDTDICSKCGNHCTIMKQCPTCDGCGTLRGESREWTISEPLYDCPDCNGNGEIETEIGEIE